MGPDGARAPAIKPCALAVLLKKADKLTVKTFKKRLYFPVVQTLRRHLSSWSACVESCLVQL